MKKIHIADLFCGAGGTSTGACEAAQLLGQNPVLTAINHWPVAIETHTKNHPTSRHLCTSLDAVNPRELFDEGQLGLLWGSPECTHHSVARGGRPVNDQSRATAWCIVRWAGAVLPSTILVENVPEFRSWGPLKRVRVKETVERTRHFMPFEQWYRKTKKLGGTLSYWEGVYGGMKPGDKRKMKREITVNRWVPDPDRKGEIYQAWKKSIEAFGYRSDERILCAADYGDPTTRHRLFVQFVRGKRKIVWPDPTHGSADDLNGDLQLFGQRLPWVPARDIIDWTQEGQSIFARKKPLAPKTLNRIWAGLMKFGLKPFLVPKEGVHGGNAPRSVDSPVNTVVSDGRVHLAEPYVVTWDHTGGKAERSGERSVDKPLSSVTSKARHGVAKPFLVKIRGTSKTASVDDPAPAVTGGGTHLGLAEPFIVPHFGERKGQKARAHSINKPLPAVTGQGAGSLIQPVIIGLEHTGANGGEARPVNLPVSTISAHARKGIAQAFLVQVAHGDSKKDKNPDGRRAHSIEKPCPTVCGNRGELGIAEPFIIKTNHSNSGKKNAANWNAHSIKKPLGSVTTAVEHALVEPHLIPQQSKGAPRSVNEPTPTVATKGAIGLVEPCLIKFYGTGGSASVEKPLDTVTAKERFGLVQPIVEIDGERYLLDIRFRMLQPHELSLAQGFRADYQFAGNKTEIVKQIGNAVPRRLARAIVLAALSQRSDISHLIPKEKVAAA
jgi:DNA (cytosine-5)-methyltransferase 1